MPANEFPLAVVVRAIDKATAPLRAINAQILSMTRPVRALATGGFNAAQVFGTEAGLFRIAAGVGAVRHAMGQAIHPVRNLATHLAGLAAIGGGAGVFGAFELIKHAIEGGDKLQKGAIKTGLSVQALREYQFAADRAGVAQEEFNSGIDQFNARMGELRANRGPLKEFLSVVSPALLVQLRATKNTEQALDLMFRAMARLPDAQRKMALAKETFGRGGVDFPLMVTNGAEEIEKLRKEYRRLAGDQTEFAKAAEEAKDATEDLSAAFEGTRNRAFVAIFPVLTELLKSLTEWLAKNREQIAGWARAFATGLPEKLERVAHALESIYAAILPVARALGWLIDLIDRTVGVGNALAGVIVAKLIVALWPLILALKALGVAMLTTPLGWFIAGVAALAAAAFLVWRYWTPIIAFFERFGESILLAGGIVAAFIVGPIAILVAGVAAAVLAIVKHWTEIKDFFGGMFDWFDSKFNALVGWVSDFARAADALIPDWLRRLLGGGEITGLSARPTIGATPSNAPGFGARGESRVTVDFENMPRGARVRVDPGSTGNLDINTGWSMNEALGVP